MRRWLPQAGSIDGLTTTEAPTPEPGRGRVLVRPLAASLNDRGKIVIRIE